MSGKPFFAARQKDLLKPSRLMHSLQLPPKSGPHPPGGNTPEFLELRRRPTFTRGSTGIPARYFSPVHSSSGPPGIPPPNAALKTLWSQINPGFLRC